MKLCCHVSLRERLESGCTPEPTTGCWLWTRMVDKDGYGKIRNGRKTGRALAHRVSYELNVGPIPPGVCVCHRCDTPACINPAHLFLGSQGDNSTDRSMKGRSAVGSKHPNAKLTEADVREIHALKRGTLTCADIAWRYGVSAGLIRHIFKGRAWVHVKPQ